MTVSMKVHQKLRQCPMLVLHVTKRLAEQFKKIFTNSFFSFILFSDTERGTFVTILALEKHRDNKHIGPSQ